MVLRFQVPSLNARINVSRGLLELETHHLWSLLEPLSIALSCTFQSNHRSALEFNISLGATLESRYQQEKWSIKYQSVLITVWRVVDGSSHSQRRQCRLVNHRQIHGKLA